jgi:hypothetical protein
MNRVPKGRGEQGRKRNSGCKFSEFDESYELTNPRNPTNLRHKKH